MELYSVICTLDSTFLLSYFLNKRFHAFYLFVFDAQEDGGDDTSVYGNVGIIGGDVNATDV